MNTGPAKFLRRARPKKKRPEGRCFLPVPAPAQAAISRATSAYSSIWSKFM